LKSSFRLKSDRSLVIFLLAAGLFLQKSGFSQIKPAKNFPRLDALKRTIAAKIEHGEVASLSIAVAQQGKIVWEESFGWADKHKELKATPYTVYPLASLSKAITATGIFLLASQKKINLEDAVSQHLSSVQLSYHNCAPEDLKVFHLLNMAGGIPHMVRYYYSDSGETVPTVKDQIKQFGFTAFPPGSVFHYSNFSFAILDQLISDNSGVEFPAYMKRFVFEPIGMKHTYADKDMIPAGEDVAAGYNRDGDQVPRNRFEPRGGAGFYSSAHDILLFGLFHLHNRGESGEKALINEKLFSQIHQVRRDLPGSYYANGWGVLKTDDRTTLLSNGAIAGCASSLVVIPEDEIAVVCLSNSTVGNEYTDKIAFEIADSLEPGYLEQLNALLAKGEKLFADKPFVFAEQYRGTWSGHMRAEGKDIPLTIRFDASGKVEWSVDGQPETELHDLREGMGLFQASSSASLPVESTKRFKHHLELEVQLSASRISGIVRAVSDEIRPMFSLPYYAELTRSHQSASRLSRLGRVETTRAEETPRTLD
jgi:CubicO group peptidase (beta-lactamase class C family)